MDEALLGRIRDGLKRSRLAHVVAAVVFGSRPRGTATPSSDIDLLVVAQEIRSKPHRRAEEIAGIKRHLPGLALDVLLLTAEEAQSNFRNHNPLFLDIAAEGIVLVDDQGWLRGLMEEVREYIKQKGIEKTEHGWRFPVIPGIPTYL